VSRIHQIIAFLVSLLFVALVLEGGLRLIGFGPRPTMNRFDPEMGWTKSPSTSLRRHTSEFDVTLETNSRGLREDESVGYEKPAETTRILLLGDSFALGYTVDHPDTISQLLQRELRDQGRSVQVVNAGTEGYSTDQEVLWLAREGRRYAPDVVVLQMYENDIFWNGQDRYFRYPKPKLDPSQPPEAALASRPPLADPGREPWLVRSTALGTTVSGMISPPALPMLGTTGLPAEWGPRLRDDGPGWAETRAALAAFKAAAQQIGAKPLVLVIPDKAQVDPASREAMAGAIRDPAYDPARPYRGMVAAAKAVGLEVVDSEKAMVAAAQGGERQLYFGKDWHTNGLGNRVLADQLAVALASPALLGAPPHEAPPLGMPEPAPAGVPRWARVAAIVVAIWLLLGTLYWRRFPDEGAARSYGFVGGLVAAVVAIFVGIDWLVWHLPPWLSRWVTTVLVLGILGAVLWYLKPRLPVMGELFATFVRRGQWYLLPVLVGLMSVGALLVVAASSPWLAPFIYTLF
jgi:lysophospholipase L1-like esterase